MVPQKGILYMKCREFESNIQDFITGKLPDSKYGKFIEHYNNCKECNEELEILYVIHNTINNDTLDSQSFNLKDKLQSNIKEIERSLNRRYKFNILEKTIVMIAEIITLSASIFYVIFTLSFL